MKLDHFRVLCHVEVVGLRPRRQGEDIGAGVVELGGGGWCDEGEEDTAGVMLRVVVMMMVVLAKELLINGRHGRQEHNECGPHKKQLMNGRTVAALFAEAMTAVAVDVSYRKVL